MCRNKKNTSGARLRAKRANESARCAQRSVSGAIQKSESRTACCLKVLTLIAGLFACSPALAVCTQSGSLTANTTTAIVGSNDISGIEGRHYFLIMNTGTTNGMNVAIGSSNNATTKDMYLAPGASWVMTMQNLKMVPGGDVAAISASGTNYACCDW